jgi:hypothetical protein
MKMKTKQPNKKPAKMTNEELLSAWIDARGQVYQRGYKGLKLINAAKKLTAVTNELASRGFKVDFGFESQQWELVSAKESA